MSAAWLHTLADHLDEACPGDRSYAMWLSAERSDFVRFNHGRVRQPGTVQQATATLRWMRGRRHASAEVTITGDRREDGRRLDQAVRELEAVLSRIPEDPHLVLPDAVRSSDDHDGGARPDARHAVDAIVQTAEDLDLVGIYAGGEVVRGYCDDRGQRNTFTRHGFVLDWCLVHDADKASKARLAGAAWDDAAFATAQSRAAAELAHLTRPGRALSPGPVRAFLGPRAVGELLSLLSHDGFGAKAIAQKRSPLWKLADGVVALDPRVHLVEDVAGGLAPAFGPDGFVRPPMVPLIVDGALTGRLVSPRTAAELDLRTTGADASESPSSLRLAGGALDEADVLGALGTGLYVPDLWYTNHSDRNQARVTGMTRFATLWVQDGEVVGPVDVMRFDDSLYDLLGPRLIDLTRDVTLLPSTSTYGFRDTSSLRVPGLLVEGLRLTL